MLARGKGLLIKKGFLVDCVVSCCDALVGFVCLVALSACLVAWRAAAHEVAWAVVSAGVFFDEMIGLEFGCPFGSAPVAGEFHVHEVGSVASVFG